MAAKEITTLASQRQLSDKKSDSAALRKSHRAPKLSQCRGQLENIKGFWIIANTACLAHEAAAVRNQRIRQLNNRATLALAVVTAVSTLPQLLGENGNGIWAITVITAFLTSASKGIEQIYARPEDLRGHLTAAGIFRGKLANLNFLVAQLDSYIRGELDLDLEEIHAKVQSMGGEIEDTRRTHIVLESGDHRVQALKDFFDTAQLTGALMRQFGYQAQFELVKVEKSIDSVIKAIR